MKQAPWAGEAVFKAQDFTTCCSVSVALTTTTMCSKILPVGMMSMLPGPQHREQMRMAIYQVHIKSGSKTRQEHCTGDSMTCDRPSIRGRWTRIGSS